MGAENGSEQRRNVLRYPYVDMVECRDRDAPQVERTWSALIRALQFSTALGCTKIAPELLSRQLRRLHRYLVAQMPAYQSAVSPRDSRTSRLGECQVLYQRALERLEVLNMTPQRQAPIHDYPWSGAHYVIQGEVRLRRYRRLHLVARPWLYELALQSDQTLIPGDVVQYDVKEGSIHELTVQSEFGSVLTVCTGRGVRSKRCRYEPLGDLGFFEELVLADAVPVYFEQDSVAIR